MSRVCEDMRNQVGSSSGTMAVQKSRYALTRETLTSVYTKRCIMNWCMHDKGASTDGLHGMSIEFARRLKHINGVVPLDAIENLPNTTSVCASAKERAILSLVLQLTQMPQTHLASIVIA